MSLCSHGPWNPQTLAVRLRPETARKRPEEPGRGIAVINTPQTHNLILKMTKFLRKRKLRILIIMWTYFVSLLTSIYVKNSKIHFNFVFKIIIMIIYEY